MKTRGMVWLFAVAAVTACADEDAAVEGANGGGSGGPTATDPGAEGFEGVEAPFARACGRLHGECASVCDNVFVECYDSVGTCTQQWTADHLQDFDFPVVDEDLVAKCAAQVDRQPCTDLRPDTLECDYAVVDSCPGDDDGYGAPYSPLSAVPIEIGQRLDLDLCDGVDEFFSVQVEAGTALELVYEDDGPTLYDDLMLLSTNAAGDTIIEWIAFEEPVPVTGEYILAVGAASRSHRALRLAVHVDD